MPSFVDLEAVSKRFSWSSWQVSVAVNYMCNLIHLFRTDVSCSLSSHVTAASYVGRPAYVGRVTATYVGELGLM